MSARFRVVVVGRSRCAWAQEATSDYALRCRRYGGLEESIARAEVFRGDEDRVRQVESERVRALVGKRERLVVLDERGEALDSKGFADLLRDGRSEGAAVVFALGGSYGHHASLREAAWRVVRLSDLVLNHEVARVVLYEQIYRGLSILEGTPYHHA